MAYREFLSVRTELVEALSLPAKKVQPFDRLRANGEMLRNASLNLEIFWLHAEFLIPVIPPILLPPRPALC